MRHGWIEIVRAVQLRVAMAALVGMMLVTVGDVVMRYGVNHPIEGAYGAVEACLAVFVFFGIASTFIARRNIVIDLIDAALPRVGVVALIRFADIVSLLCLLVIFYAMIDPALQAYDYGDAKPQLELPLAWLWAAAFVGLAGTVVSAAGAFLTPVGVTHHGGAREP